jgi:hypothetical protein
MARRGVAAAIAGSAKEATGAIGVAETVDVTVILAAGFGVGSELEDDEA